MNDDRPHIVVVVDRYPSPTETFIQREVRFLERFAGKVSILGCASAMGAGPLVESAPPGGAVPRGTPSGVRDSPGPGIVTSFLGALVRRPFRTASLCAAAGASSRATLHSFWITARAVATAQRVAAALRAAKVTHLHAHFLHQPALLAMLLARMLRVPYSLQAHARDIFVPELRLESLCRDARFIAVCSEQGSRALRARLSGPTAAKVALIRHGLELSELPFVERRTVPEGERLEIVSICRLVPKKGVDDVLNALALAKQRGVRFSLRVIGDGPMRETLTQLAAHLALEEVRFYGLRPHDETLEALRRSDLLVMGCRVAEDGDRDGVPNAILEAMALGVPVVASGGGGVAEVVTDGRTGILVPSGSRSDLAAAIVRLAGDLPLRRRVAAGARALVEEHFDLLTTGPRLLALLR